MLISEHLEDDQLIDNTGTKVSATKISNQLFIFTLRKQQKVKNQELQLKLQIIKIGQPRSLLWNIFGGEILKNKFLFLYVCSMTQ